MNLLPKENFSRESGWCSAHQAMGACINGILQGEEYDSLKGADEFFDELKAKLGK